LHEAWDAGAWDAKTRRGEGTCFFMVAAGDWAVMGVPRRDRMAQWSSSSSSTWREVGRGRAGARVQGRRGKGGGVLVYDVGK
jgi:hypothetical protein